MTDQSAYRITETIRDEIDHRREWAVSAPDTPGQRVSFTFRPHRVIAVYTDADGHVEARKVILSGPRVKADGSAGAVEHSATYMWPLGEQSDAPAWLRALLRDRMPATVTRPRT